MTSECRIISQISLALDRQFYTFATLFVIASLACIMLLTVPTYEQEFNIEADINRPHRNIVYISELYVPGFTQAKPFLCKDQGRKIRLLILIASAPKNFDRRKAIRQTWGKYRSRNDVVIAFVLGTHPQKLTQSIAYEDSKHEDLIIGKFVDSYRNLTLKSLAMLEWIDEYCSKADRFIKSDDDAHLNIPAWFITSKKNASLTIWGNVFHRVFPHRTALEKYYVPRWEFPGKMFPNYTAGLAYMMTLDCVRPLRLAAFKERFLRLDDVFVTGVLAQKVGIKLRSVQRVYKTGNVPYAKFAIESVSPDDQWAMWNLERQSKIDHLDLKVSYLISPIQKYYDSAGFDPATLGCEVAL